jgi:Ca-activated chloride channel family protein
LFVHELESGIQQVLGRLELETARRRIAIEAPTRAENGSLMTVGWSGGELEGDFLSIAPKGSDILETVFCSPAIGEGAVSLSAPDLPGDYVIRYLSRRGRLLAGVDLEVFEILATLDGPTEVAPGESFGVVWTGPDEDQDFLSIAAVDEGDDQYRSFSLSSGGSPARLTAPKETGDYELRYVRATDGEILARAQFAVTAVGISLDVPAVVDAGTRFEAGWRGTPGAGDFIAVARSQWGPKRHLDWSFTDLGSPISLAAPFDAGRYEVRYVSGETGRIIDRREIEVR